MTDLDQRKLFSVLSHGSIFFSSFLVSIIIPIVFLAISNDPIVQANAKEAINFHLNLYLYGFIFVFLLLLMRMGIAIPLLLILFIVSWIMPIIAMVHTATNLERPYRYPLILHIL
ncbi:MAG TPA: DUF4870 domain-containing protein [Coleofasciculaceae cyanobacterium]